MMNNREAYKMIASGKCVDNETNAANTYFKMTPDGIIEVWTMDGKNVEFRKSLPAFYGEWYEYKPIEKVAYYKWRLWLKDGSMVETQHFINEKGASGSGVLSLLWKEAIKREKISEAVYKVEGQA